MKHGTWKLQSFSTSCVIILALALKLQQEYVEAEGRECEDNKFGHECRFQCKCHQNESCNVKSGACLSGCAYGYWGSNCQLSSECYYNGRKKRYRGTKSVAMNSRPCNKWNNYPHNYCRSFNDETAWCYTSAGWKYCSLNDCGCPPGLYGIDCTEQCHCKNASEVCAINTGHCISSCSPGWTGKNCDIECENGKFGDNCEKKCHCEQVTQCRRTDGHCLLGGCLAGYTGESCQKECGIGTFGKYCNQTCHCADNTKCRNSDGKCPDGACSPGYVGDQCQITCSPMTFGNACKGICQCKNDSLCNHIDGRCPDGKCKPGYRGHSCQQPCRAGKFGDGCEKFCHCKNPKNCNPENGRCTDGKCKFGYKGDTCQKRNTVFIIVVVLIPLVILTGLVAAVTTCVIKRKPEKTTESEELKSFDNLSLSQIEAVNVAYDGNATDDTYQNVVLLTKENLLVYIEKNRMEEVPFESEFAWFPQGLVYYHEVGSLEENMKKNRYKTVVPYDYTRVVLLPDELSSSDYINASYITREKRYIATQGPITGTVNDFWRMIWQEKSSTIIMLTDIIENDKLKCAKYWPDLNHTETYGKIKIHCVQEKIFMIYTYRLLSISKLNKLSEEEYYIDHFQCTTWPDHDVPVDPIYFIEFRNKVRHMQSTKTPYVVHCSAGVGRTGTYIALDILLERLWDNSGVDVFTCVNELRQQRALMVHRRRQYQFIYEVLAEAVLTSFSEMATESLPTEFQKMLCKETNKNSPLQDQHERLLLRLHQANLSITDTKESLYENMYKNDDKERSSDDIFKTAYLDGFTMMNEIILTIQPPEKITGKFWEFIYQKRCNVIVMFEDLFNAVAAYWPDDKLRPLRYGSIKVELMGLTETDNFFQRQFKVSSSENSFGDVLINHFQSKIWLGNELPSQNELIEFIQSVSGYVRPHREFLVHCQDGYSKCGLFSILYVMMQMLRTDEHVSILRLVRRMRKKNSSIAEDFRSYEYCWMIANLFIGELSVYSNF